MMTTEEIRTVQIMTLSTDPSTEEGATVKSKGKGKLDCKVSEQVANLVNAFLVMRQGDIMDWSTISEAIGEDAQATGRHYVKQAQKVMLRDHCRVYECVREVGIKWLTELELGVRGQHDLRTVNRLMRRGARKQRCLRSRDDLPASVRAKYDAHLSMIGLIYAESTHQKRYSMEVKAENSKILPPINREHLKGA